MSIKTKLFEEKLAFKLKWLSLQKLQKKQVVKTTQSKHFGLLTKRATILRRILTSLKKVIRADQVFLDHCSHITHLRTY